MGGLLTMFQTLRLVSRFIEKECLGCLSSCRGTKLMNNLVVNSILSTLPSTWFLTRRVHSLLSLLLAVLPVTTHVSGPVGPLVRRVGAAHPRCRLDDPCVLRGQARRHRVLAESTDFVDRLRRHRRTFAHDIVGSRPGPGVWPAKYKPGVVSGYVSGGVYGCPFLRSHFLLILPASTACCGSHDGRFVRSGFQGEGSAGECASASGSSPNHREGARAKGARGTHKRRSYM